MSLKTGGVGLNLTAASNVFLVVCTPSIFVKPSCPFLIISLKAEFLYISHAYIQDPWWNPAVEEQAIMRIHRIGQKRTVRVRRFIVKVTFSLHLLLYVHKKAKLRFSIIQLQKSFYETQ